MICVICTTSKVAGKCVHFRDINTYFATFNRPWHYVKSVRIRSYSGPHFSAFGLNTERYSLQMLENADPNNSEYGHFLRSEAVSVTDVAQLSPDRYRF